MGWWQNWADTSPPSDPDLAPLEIPMPIADAWPAIVAVVGALPRWRIESQDAPARVLHATHRTRLFGFVDDVTIRLEDLARATRVHARSQSRVGKGDLGQNRRNLAELLAALQKNLGRKN